MRRDRVSFQDVIQCVEEILILLRTDHIFLIQIFIFNQKILLGVFKKFLIKIEESKKFTSFNLEIRVTSLRSLH